jgi:hypothetical protein
MLCTEYLCFDGKKAKSSWQGLISSFSLSLAGCNIYEAETVGGAFEDE